MGRAELADSSNPAQTPSVPADIAGLASHADPVPPENAAEISSPADGEVFDPGLMIATFEGIAASAHHHAATRRVRHARLALACGLASVALSALSLRPEVWMSLPAAALGFTAIVLGYLTLTATRRHDHSAFTSGACVASMLLGTVGMFLGPLAFARLGRDLRELNGHSLTRRHLGELGRALNEYSDQRGTYPVGGTFVRNASGEFRGQHGWMTFLLPFIGEQALYQQIDQSKPFDALENRDPMGRPVVAYQAAEADRSKIGRGFAVSHFADVGGDIEDETGVSHAGIFARVTAVRQAEITDGLANTLVVGELAGGFPPWGDPENWRLIGRGLNRDPNGFGNAAGNGAMFLFADGAVKVLGNNTDPKLLKQLSTRDGGESRNPASIGPTAMPAR
jgi:hypothetical protein